MPPVVVYVVQEVYPDDSTSLFGVYITRARAVIRLVQELRTPDVKPVEITKGLQLNLDDSAVLSYNGQQFHIRPVVVE